MLAIIIVIVLIVVKLFAIFTLFNKAINTIMDQGTEVQKNIFGKFFSIFDKATEDINNVESKINIRNFNGTIEVFQMTGDVSPILD